ncbi:MAG TPA: hypothetical protein VKY74_18370 [Chloroflexia bacterium]|nr:hypothetical protein [Chloroflexia bacterium]
MNSDTCPHARVVISRKHGCWVRHTIYQGQHQGSRIEIGDSNGTIRVHCFDCNYQRTFVRSEVKPAWILALLPQLDPASTPG